MVDNYKLFFCLIAILLTCQSVFGQDTIVSIEPAIVHLPAVGETFEIELKITGVESLFGYELTITLDPSAIIFVSAKEGDFLPKPFPVDPVVFDNSVKYSVVQIGGDPADGEGVLATFTFEVVETKDSTLGLEAILSDQDANSILTTIEGAEITLNNKPVINDVLFDEFFGNVVVTRQLSPLSETTISWNEQLATDPDGDDIEFGLRGEEEKIHVSSESANSAKFSVKNETVEGSEIFTFVVSDGSYEITRDFSVAINIPPMLISGKSTEIEFNQSASTTIDLNDWIVFPDDAVEDDDTLDWKIVVLPDDDAAFDIEYQNGDDESFDGGLIFNGKEDEFSLSPARLKFRAEDPYGGTVELEIAVTVNAVSHSHTSDDFVFTFPQANDIVSGTISIEWETELDLEGKAIELRYVSVDNPDDTAKIGGKDMSSSFAMEWNTALTLSGDGKYKLRAAIDGDIFDSQVFYLNNEPPDLEDFPSPIILNNVTLSEAEGLGTNTEYVTLDLDDFSEPGLLEGIQIEYAVENGDTDVVETQLQNQLLTLKAVKVGSAIITVFAKEVWYVDGNKMESDTTKEEFEVVINNPVKFVESVKQIGLKVGDDPFELKLKVTDGNDNGEIIDWDYEIKDEDIDIVSIVVQASRLDEALPQKIKFIPKSEGNTIVTLTASDLYGEKVKSSDTIEIVVYVFSSDVSELILFSPEDNDVITKSDTLIQWVAYVGLSPDDKVQILLDEIPKKLTAVSESSLSFAELGDIPEGEHSLQLKTMDKEYPPINIVVDLAPPSIDLSTQTDFIVGQKPVEIDLTDFLKDEQESTQWEIEVVSGDEFTDLSKNHVGVDDQKKVSVTVVDDGPGHAEAHIQLTGYTTPQGLADGVRSELILTFLTNNEPRINDAAFENVFGNIVVTPSIDTSIFWDDDLVNDTDLDDIDCQIRGEEETIQTQTSVWVTSPSPTSAKFSVKNTSGEGSETFIFVADDGYTKTSRDFTVYINLPPVPNDLSTDIDFDEDQSKTIDLNDWIVFPVDKAENDETLDWKLELGFTDELPFFIEYKNGDDESFDGGLIFNGKEDEFSLSPSRLNFRAEDPYGGTVELEIAVTVKPVNDAPRIEKVPEPVTLTIEESHELLFSQWAWDVDGDEMTWKVDRVTNSEGNRIENWNDEIRLDFRPESVIISLLENASKSLTIYFEITDDDANEPKSTDFDYTVTTNHPPVLSNSPDQVILPEHDSYENDLSDFVEDIDVEPGEDKLTWTLLKTKFDHFLVDLDEYGYLKIEGIGVTGLEKVEDKIPIEISDEMGMKVNLELAVTVEKEPPVLSLPNTIIFEEDDEAIIEVIDNPDPDDDIGEAWAYDDDDQLDQLIWECLNSDGYENVGQAANLSNECEEISLHSEGIARSPLMETTNGVSLIFSSTETNWFGTVEAVIKITDSEGKSAEQALTIIVTEVKDAPLLSFPSQIEFTKGRSEELTISDFVSDDDDQIEELDFTDDAKNIKVDLNSAEDRIIFEPQDDDFYWYGAETITIYVTDTDGKENSQQIEIVVKDVDIPPDIVVPFEPIEFDEDDEYTIVDLASHVQDDKDEPGDISWDGTGSEHIGLKPPKGIEENEAVLTPTPDWHGTETIFLIATDSDKKSTEIELEVTVLSEPEPPTLTPPSEPIEILEDGQTIVELDEWVSDDDDSAADMRLVKVDENVGQVEASEDANSSFAAGEGDLDDGSDKISVDFSNGKATFRTAEENWSGDVEITIQITDSDNLSDEAIVKIRVIPVNDPPIVSDVQVSEILNEPFATREISFTISNPEGKGCKIKAFYTTINGEKKECLLDGADDDGFVELGIIPADETQEKSVMWFSGVEDLAGEKIDDLTVSVQGFNDQGEDNEGQVSKSNITLDNGGVFTPIIRVKLEETFEIMIDNLSDPSAQLEKLTLKVDYRRESSTKWKDANIKVKGDKIFKGVLPDILNTNFELIWHSELDIPESLNGVYFLRFTLIEKEDEQENVSDEPESPARIFWVGKSGFSEGKGRHTQDQIAPVGPSKTIQLTVENKLIENGLVVKLRPSSRIITPKMSGYNDQLEVLFYLTNEDGSSADIRSSEFSIYALSGHCVYHRIESEESIEKSRDELANGWKRYLWDGKGKYGTSVMKSGIYIYVLVVNDGEYFDKGTFAIAR